MLRPVTLALGSALLIACDASSDATTTARTITVDSAGVRWRTIPSAEQVLDSLLTEDVRITPADSGAASFGALYHGNVATNGVDRVYVFDNDDSRIVVFDDTGAALGVWGRRGAGPGEIGFGGDLSVGPDGAVWLFDYQQSAFVRFDTTGTPLPLLRLPDDSVGTSESPVRAVPGGLSFVSRTMEGDSIRRTLRFATERDTASLGTQSESVKRDVSFPSCPMLRLSGLPPYFSPELSTARTPRGVAALRAAAWRVDWYEGARLVEVWTRDVPARTPDAALLEAEVDGALTFQFGSDRCTVPAKEAGDVRGMAATVPALRRIAVAPDGTLWAERWEPTSATQRVDVLQPDGTLLGTIVGRGAPLGFLRNGRVVYADTDPDTEVQSLVVFSVRGAAW